MTLAVDGLPLTGLAMAGEERADEEAKASWLAYSKVIPQPILPGPGRTRFLVPLASLQYLSRCYTTAVEHRRLISDCCTWGEATASTGV